MSTVVPRMKILFLRFLSLALTCITCSYVFAESGTPVANQADWSEFSRKNLFVIDICRNLSGRIWIGTEDEGVFCYDPKKYKGRRWKQFADRLGYPNGYAVACDRLGRIWVGHAQ